VSLGLEEVQERLAYFRAGHKHKSNITAKAETGTKTGGILERHPWNSDGFVAAIRCGACKAWPLPTSLMAGSEPAFVWRRETGEIAKIFTAFSLYLLLITFIYLYLPLPTFTYL
jgi:hypothetical protein